MEQVIWLRVRTQLCEVKQKASGVIYLWYWPYCRRQCPQNSELCDALRLEVGVGLSDLLKAGFGLSHAQILKK